MANQLFQTNVGSTDWAGRVAPPGGTKSGTSVIIMQDGTQFVVGHVSSEVVQLCQHHHPVQAGTPRWTAFDASDSGLPVILDANLIVKVLGGTILSEHLRLGQARLANGPDYQVQAS